MSKTTGAGLGLCAVLCLLAAALPARATPQGAQASIGRKAGWKAEQPLPAARSGLAAATGADGHIYAIGGFGVDGLPAPQAEVWAFDQEARSWSAAAPLP